MSGISFEHKKGKVELGIMSIPNRKRKALYINGRGKGLDSKFICGIDVLAYFRNEECEQQFEELLEFILDITKSKQDVK